MRELITVRELFDALYIIYSHDTSEQYLKDNDNGDDLNTLELFEIQKKYRKHLEQKYLPQSFSVLYDSIYCENEKLFLEGLKCYLWNTDCFNYKLNNIEIQKHDEYIYKIIFYLN